ncbi:MAG: hypothetical protein KGM99_15385 [Burkholderiales bacterium]|nr:hypothetical protein [Burkholderiales bacterium]
MTTLREAAQGLIEHLRSNNPQIGLDVAIANLERALSAPEPTGAMTDAERLAIFNSTETVEDALAEVEAEAMRRAAPMEPMCDDIKFAESIFSFFGWNADSPASAELVERLAQKISAQFDKRMNELRPKWLPIESAPKDGGWIITNSQNKEVIPNYWLGSDIESWAKSSFDSPPTHWMPLPAAPAQQEVKQ